MGVFVCVNRMKTVCRQRDDKTAKTSRIATNFSISGCEALQADQHTQTRAREAAGICVRECTQALPLLAFFGAMK